MGLGRGEKHSWPTRRCVRAPLFHYGSVPLRFHCSTTVTLFPGSELCSASDCLPLPPFSASSQQQPAQCTLRYHYRHRLPLHRLRSALRQPPSLTSTFPLLLPHQDSRRIDRVASPSPSLPFFSSVRVLFRSCLSRAAERVRLSVRLFKDKTSQRQHGAVEDALWRISWLRTRGVCIVPDCESGSGRGTREGS